MMNAPHKVNTAEALPQWRESQLGLVAAVASDQIEGLSHAQLSDIQITPLSRLGDDEIEFPKEWMPSGALQARCRRVIDLGKLASTRHPKANHQVVRTSLMRMLLALWVIPRHSRRGAISIKPSTYVDQCQVLIGLARIAMESWNSVDGSLFAGMPGDVVTTAVRAGRIPKTEAFKGLLNGLFDLHSRGIIKDWISERPDTEGSAGPTTEQGRRGNPELRSEKQDSDKWQPLPDEFVSEFGWRCLWFMENLGPGLIDCYARCLAEEQKQHLVSRRTSIRSRDAAIACHDWRAVDGSPISELPFKLDLTGETDRKLTSAWPPKRFVSLKRCMAYLQACHLFVVLFATGARWSEVAGFSRQCLITEHPDDPRRIEGRTWKLVDEVGGATRSWPLHPVAAAAIQQQIALANLLRPSGLDLWIPWTETRGGEFVESLNNASPHLRGFATATGVLDTLHSSSLHPHRFRKTVARLAALALVGAPKILMDLFGHKSIEMTLRYILSDPTLAAEIEEVAKAQVIMLGEQAVADADTNGGPAAKALRTQVAGAMRGDRNPLNADDIREAAEILTMQGRSVQLVRPNVLCTKGPRESGPCTKSIGHPDPSRCKVHCNHRLELAAARDDVDKAISQCVAMLGDAAAMEDELQWAFWRGQLKHHIARFEDIGMKWSRSADVVRLLSERISA